MVQVGLRTHTHHITLQKWSGSSDDVTVFNANSHDRIDMVLHPAFQYDFVLWTTSSMKNNVMRQSAAAVIRTKVAY